MTKKLLDRVLDIAERLCGEKGDVRKLKEPLRTVAAVSYAQGIIDNGGFRYFFERDWPHQPPYSVFSVAYRSIGATAQADALEAAAAAFGLENPERRCEERVAFLGTRRGARVIDGLDRQGMTEDVWALLAKFVRKNRDALIHGELGKS